MEAAKKFLKVDYYIQRIIGVPCVIFTFVLYGLLLLMPFGAWQVISSLILVFYYGDKKRIPHLIFTGIWMLVLMLIVYFDISSDSLFIPFIFIPFIVIPAGVGVWYYNLTRKDYYALHRIETREKVEDILDAGI